ncbi:Hint domain-containing protein [Roseomonas sp. BN140053]|uniref:Hint domain-containing protein n=1 Tax=Roseomonas sp. BN140053 TaxID=3391898 RepID=UPI0039EBB29B
MPYNNGIPTEGNNHYSPGLNRLGIDPGLNEAPPNAVSDDTLAGGDGSDTMVMADGAVTFAALACFASGTRIATERGPVAVEDLVIGDMALTCSGRHGASAPVKRIGWRRFDLLRHPRPEKVAPVRIRAGALGENVPSRDLVVSPDHCMWLKDSLVPARLLVNGTTVIREAGYAHVTYWHVELEHHDLLVAEGALSESYLDTGNRHAFSNGSQVEMLHADFTEGDSDARLAPRLPADGGEVAKLIRAELQQRADEMALAEVA